MTERTSAADAKLALGRYPLGQTVLVPVDLLHFSERNPRTITAERLTALRKAIRADPEHLLARPCICTPDGEILAGNMRWQAAREEGLAEVPVFFTDRGDADARLLMLRDNAPYGEWENDALAELLDELRGFDADLELAGFRNEELEALLAQLGTHDGDDDSIPEPPDEPQSRPGEVYELGPHRLMCGDATNAEHVSKLLGDEQARLLFTSPPYLDLRDYGGQSSEAADLAKFIPLFADRAELLAVNLGLVQRDGEIVRYWDAYLDAAGRAGLKLLAWNVWNREDATNIGAQTQMTFPLWHEWIFMFGHTQQRGNKTLRTKHAGAKTTLGQRQRDGSFRGPRSYVVARWKSLGSVLTLPSHKGASAGDHPAVFPVALPREYLRSLTDRGDAVVDPFAGSGSTLIACEELGRRCYLMEVDPRYCDVIRRRYAAHARQSDLAP
jgi:DNA modification methylase